MAESETRAKPYSMYAGFVEHKPITAAEIPQLWETIENSDDNAEALYRLAIAYLKGEGGIDIDHENAVKYMCRAARKNHQLALYNMALLWFKFGNEWINAKVSVEVDEYSGFIDAWNRLERSLDIKDFAPAQFLTALLLYAYPEYAERLPDYRHLASAPRTARIKHDAEEAMIQASCAGFNPARLALGSALIQTAAAEGMPEAGRVDAALRTLFHTDPLDVIRTIAYAPKPEAGR